MCCAIHTFSGKYCRKAHCRRHTVRGLPKIIPKLDADTRKSSFNTLRSILGNACAWERDFTETITSVGVDLGQSFPVAMAPQGFAWNRSSRFIVSPRQLDIISVSLISRSRAWRRTQASISVSAHGIGMSSSEQALPRSYRLNLSTLAIGTATLRPPIEASTVSQKL